MAEKLKLEMVTPYKKVLSEEVDEITAPEENIVRLRTQFKC